MRRTGRPRAPSPSPSIPTSKTRCLASWARSCAPGDYELCLARYRDPATPQDEVRYLSALAAFPDRELAARTFDLAVGEVRTQNGPSLIMSLLVNRIGGPVAWGLLEAHWSSVLERFPVNGHSRMLAGVRTLCGDGDLAAEVTSFLRQHPVRSGQRSVEQSLERLAINVAFAERERTRVGATPGPVGWPGRRLSRPAGRLGYLLPS